MHLLNSPQLEIVYPQTMPNKLKEAKVNKRIMNQQVLKRKTNVWFKQKHTRKVNTYHNLQRQHVNKMNPKYKNHTKHTKTKQAQS